MKLDKTKTFIKIIKIFFKTFIYIIFFYVAVKFAIAYLNIISLFFFRTSILEGLMSWIYIILVPLGHLMLTQLPIKVVNIIAKKKIIPIPISIINYICSFLVLIINFWCVKI